MAQNPHHYRYGERQGHGEPGRSAHEQQKPSNRTQGRPHFRYKTRPAHPFSPHVRYIILLARPKSLNLARFARTGRVLYRSHHQEAKQGEFCTECEAESGLAMTAHHAPRAWRTPTGQEGAGGPGCGARRRRQGLAGLRDEAQAHVSTPGTTGAESATGPGCGARGRRQGLAGLRDDAPSEARGADGRFRGVQATAQLYWTNRAERKPGHPPRGCRESRPYSHMRPSAGTVPFTK